MSFKASAPGSLMLLGEYAVLKGGHSLVAAVNHRMTVQLLPRKDSIVHITSQLGTFATDISRLEVKAPFQFVLTVLQHFQSFLSSGFNLIIESEFSDQIGFASSAAVTVATIKVLHAWQNKLISDEDLIRAARAVVREVQGIGSGADVAACVLGGVVAYRAEPFIAEKISYDFPITVVYSGSKTKTADAIAHVQNYFSEQPELLNKLSQEINACAEAGIQAVREQNHDKLGNIMNLQQDLMENLGVCTPILSDIIDSLRKSSNILGAKISGSGLGDCVVGLGDFASQIQCDGKELSVAITSQGVHCEKN